MYKIGELSKLCNMSVKALRYYDSEGLLVPDRIDKFTGYRYEIKTIDGKEYLFKEWKCGDYSFGGGRVYFYVFTRE